jgi:hypothetical protein
MSETIQHVNIKVFTAPGSAEPDLEKVNHIFHGWIQAGYGEELLLDVADYAHVPDGPGMMLIGHEVNYSLDFVIERRAGLLYNRKTHLEGDNAEQFRHAVKRTFAACDALEQHPSLGGALKFNRQDLVVVINDRALVANDEATFQRLKPDLDAVFGELFADSHKLEFVQGDARERFAVKVTASAAPAAV